MDPGHFLTNSGSKIPMPKSRKEKDVSVVAPLKPKLAVCKVTTTNFKPESCESVNDNCSEDSDIMPKPKAQVATNCKYATRNNDLLFVRMLYPFLYLHDF